MKEDPKNLIRDNGFVSADDLTDEELLLDAAAELEKYHREKAAMNRQTAKWRGGHPYMRGNCR